MSYKAILVHADPAPHASYRVTLAARLARSFQAHLTVLACTGLSRFAARQTSPRQWPQLQQKISEWRAQARTGLATCAAIARQTWPGHVSRRLLDDDLEGGLIRYAPVNDLLVLGQPDPDHAIPGAVGDLLHNLLLHGGRPLLLVPHAPAPPSTVAPDPRPFHHALVAWDGRPTAARAISDALPLLKQAERVTLAVLWHIGRPAENDHGAEPGADMALFLARHGLQVDVLREYTTATMGAALLSIATERQCDLLVMGGYGHDHAWRTGHAGTTGTVLANMTLPVLLSH